MTFDSDRKYDKEGEQHLFFTGENKEYYTRKEAIESLIEAKIYYRVKECIKQNGLERAEDIIKEIYNTIPKLRERLLKTLYFIWGR